MSKRPMVLEIYKSSPCGCTPGDSDCARAAVAVWRWRIRATNGRILADSGEAYQRLRDCAHGAGLVTGFYLVGAKPGDDARRGAWRIVVDK